MTSQVVTTEPYVFISYASADRERVLPVVAAVRAAGVGVWFDQADIGGGTNYGLEIAEGIERCAAFILLCSTASLASRNVKQEIQLAWKFERPYLPLLLEPVTIPKDVAYWLEGSQWVEVFDGPETAWLPTVLAALAPFGITPARDTEAPLLAGREREMALLHEHLAAATVGRGSLVLIGGEAGIGKTTLASALCDAAQQAGATVLTGHCFDLAETPPYGPWIDLFAHCPAALALPPAFAERGTVGAVPSQMALFVQVEDFLTALTATRPAVLLLDDLHWSDPASLDLLRFLARSLPTHRLLLLVTYRSDELTRRHPLYVLLPQLAREAGAERIDLRRLDDDAVHALVTARYSLPDDAAARLVAYLQARAEGNALFVGELLRSLEEASVLRQDGDDWQLGDLANATLPALLRQVIDGRLARLDDESQRLLGVAAVIGHEVSLAVWATVGEVDEDAVLAVAEEGLAARLLVEGADGESVRFAHALIRESLYEGIPAIRRRRIHRQVGETLAGQSQPDPDAMAYHFQQAGDARAAEWLIRAGTRAMAAFAEATAFARFEEALPQLTAPDTASTRFSVLLRLLTLHRSKRDSIEYGEEAVRIAQELGDELREAAALLRLGYARAINEDLPRGLAEQERAIAMLASFPDVERVRDDVPQVLGQGRELLALALVTVGRIAEARALAQSGDPRYYGYFALMVCEALLGHPDTARAIVQQGMADIPAGDDRTHGNFGDTELRNVVIPYFADDPAEVRRVATAAEGAWAQIGEAILGWSPHLAWLAVLVVQGQWEEAWTQFPATRLSRHSLRRSAIEWWGVLARGQGKPALAWELVQEMFPNGPAVEPGTVVFRRALGLQETAALLSLDDHDRETARPWIEAHDRWLAWNGAVLGQSEGQALWAQYHRQAGDADIAREHAERALAHATAPRQPLALLAAHRLLGELEADAGRYADAETHLYASLTLAEACAAPYERALTLLAMAELRAATGTRDAARTLLEDVRAICAPLGAKPALARTEAIAARL